MYSCLKTIMLKVPTICAYLCLNCCIFFSIIITCMQQYDRRSKMVRDTDERNLWGQLNSSYMTDEETDDEGGGFIQHKLKWRSTILDRLV